MEYAGKLLAGVSSGLLARSDIPANDFNLALMVWAGRQKREEERARRRAEGKGEAIKGAVTPFKELGTYLDSIKQLTPAPAPTK